MSEDLPERLKRVEQKAQDAHDWLFQTPRDEPEGHANAVRLRRLLSAHDAAGRGWKFLKSGLGFVVLLSSAAAAIVYLVKLVGENGTGM